MKTPEEMEKTLDDHQKVLQEIRDFMHDLKWLADISKATELLKKPSLWIVAVVFGLAAFYGGIKTLVGVFISLFIAKN